MLCRNEVRIQYSEGISDTKLSDAWPGHWEGVLLSLVSLPMLIAHSVSTFLVISLSRPLGHPWSHPTDLVTSTRSNKSQTIIIYIFCRVSAVQRCYAIYYLRCIVGNMLMLIWEKLYLD